MTPAVHQGGDISASELDVHDAVNNRIDARACPERQRSHHVDAAVETRLLIGQVCDGVRQIGENERKEHG